MLYELSKTARLPLQYVKGSPSQRAQLSDKLFNDFCDNISFAIKSDTLSINEIKDCFSQTLPSKIGFQISDIGKIFYNENFGVDGFTGYMIRGKNRKISGFNIFLPLDKEKKNFHIGHLDILFHEMKHVYDYLTNPKTLGRGFYVPHKLQDFYDDKIYPRDAVSLDKLGVRINNKIKRLPYYKRLDFLQDCRASLESEINAFSAEKVYDRFARQYPKKMLKNKVYDDIDYFNFREKLAIVEGLLRNELLKLRNENKELFGQK